MAFRPTIPAYSTQGKSFSRTAAFPLEGYEIWTDLEALKAYAANTDPAKDPSYIGQKVAYVDYDNNRVIHYGIEIDGTLKELGADKMGIDALTKADEGKVPKAFYVVDTPAVGEEGSEDYQPEVGHVEIRWIIPDTFEDTNTITVVEAGDNVTVETITEGSTNTYTIDVDLSDYAFADDVKLLEDEIYGKVKEGYGNIFVDSDNGVIIGGSAGSLLDVEYIIIPSEANKLDGSSVPSIELYPVTSIPVLAFEDCVSLKEVAIPETVTAIGSDAFDGCPLETIYFGGSEDAWNNIDFGTEITGVNVIFNSEGAKKIGLIDEVSGIKEGVYTKEEIDNKFKELPDYTVTCDDTDVEETESTPAFKRHVLKQGGQTVCTIDIPKELVVDSGSVIVATEEDKANDDAVVVGETYIKLVIANQEAPLYIAAKDLIEYITVDATSKTIELELGDDHVLKAKVKISAEEGNSLVEKEDGLYVNAPVLPTATDTAVENKYVTAVDQKNGKITVTRKQISYNELADIPTIPGESDFGVLSLEGEDAIEVTGGQDKVVKLLIDETNKGNVTLTQSENGLKAEVTIPDIDIATAIDKTLPADNKPVIDKVVTTLAANEHTITPTVLEVVTKAGWDKVVGENGVRVLNQEEINKLNALNIEADGNVAISGTINATNVHGLGVEVIDIVTGTGDYVSTPAIGEEGGENYIPAVVIAKLGIEKGAQVNKVEAVALPDAVLAINDKQVNIPAFVAGKYGVIKGAEQGTLNAVIAQADGTGKVEKVSTDSLVQGELELILNGGNASLT